MSPVEVTIPLEEIVRSSPARSVTTSPTTVPETVILLVYGPASSSVSTAVMVTSSGVLTLPATVIFASPLMVIFPDVVAATFPMVKIPSLFTNTPPVVV